MPPKRKSLGPRAQLDRELAELEERRGRLLAARAALDGDVVVPKEKPRRLRQVEIDDYLREHPGSTYLEIAAGVGAPPVNVAGILSRGRKVGHYRNDKRKWYLED